MRVSQFLAPVVCAVFGLYAILAGILDSSNLTSERGGAAFIGVLLLVLATVHWRVNLQQERPSAPVVKGD